MRELQGSLREQERKVAQLQVQENTYVTLRPCDFPGVGTEKTRVRQDTICYDIYHLLCLSRTRHSFPQPYAQPAAYAVAPRAA